MKKIYTLLSCILLLGSSALSAQISFTNKNNLLSPSVTHSGVAVAVLDMNGDGLDDVVRMDQGYKLSIEYQGAANRPFSHLKLPDVSNDSQWGMCAGDVDNNGYPDVLTGGYYDGVKIVHANANGTSYLMETITNPQTFVQGVNFADINNDGWLDAFVCHDDAEARIYINDGAGHLVYTPNVLNLNTVPASDNSGNYGSVWCDVDNDGDVDLYIAKCRQGVNDPTDGRRINMLFINNGDNTFTQDVTNERGLRIGAQSWTADFEDIDNDGDFDCFITNHDVDSQLLENDGTGHFTDITAAAGLSSAINGLPIQGIMRDFDNDGFVDILVAGEAHYLFRNNGDKTFTEIPDLFGDHVMESFAIGDLNDDGFMDIYGSFADIYTTPTVFPDILFMNNGNGNHFFELNLHGVKSNRDGVGARITLYSPLGTQVREVRSGEGYGIMNSMQAHFGLGQYTQIDSVTVRWPSGTLDVIHVAVDTRYTLYEGGCLLPAVGLLANGPTVFCSGDSVQLSVADFYDHYAWSTGDSSSTIWAHESGNYKVTVTNGSGCTAVSKSISIAMNPVETPSIAVTGDTIFCAGGSVVLTSSPSSHYVWSNGAETQNIEATETGTYSVAVQGLCGWFSSPPVQVNVLSAPAPVATGDVVALNTPAHLGATGDQVHWYANQSDPSPLLIGNSFTTPPLSASQTYWVSAVTTYDVPNQFTGMTDHVGSQFGSNTFNGAIIFDCYQPFRLANVKVYTNLAGQRKVDLKTATGTVLQTKTVDIPVGTTVISLDFDVPVGTGLVLTTDQTVNTANFGTVSPQMRRSDVSVNYPYVIPGYVSINKSNTSAGVDRYYYFYNWEIDFTGYQCESERVPVLAVVDSSIVSAPLRAWETGLKLFPNPSSGFARLSVEGFDAASAVLSLKNAQGAVLLQQTVQSNSGKLNCDLDLSAYPKGAYWVELATEAGVLRRKLAVQ